MPKTYEPIASTTLSAGTASVTFSNIPQTYTDLILISNFKGANTGNNLTLQFNSDTGTNYSRTWIYGDGSSATSGRTTNATVMFIGQSDSAQLLTNICHIVNYSNSTTYKTTLSRSNDTSGLYASTGLVAGLWRSTAAISTIKIAAGSGDLSATSSFVLYGVKSA